MATNAASTLGTSRQRSATRCDHGLSPDRARTTRPGQTLTQRPERLILSYPDGPTDAEGLAVDPRTGDVLIISKTATKPRARSIASQRALGSNQRLLCSNGWVRSPGKARARRPSDGRRDRPDRYAPLRPNLHPRTAHQARANTGRHRPSRRAGTLYAVEPWSMRGDDRQPRWRCALVHLRVITCSPCAPMPRPTQPTDGPAHPTGRVFELPPLSRFDLGRSCHHRFAATLKGRTRQAEVDLSVRWSGLNTRFSPGASSAQARSDPKRGDHPHLDRG